MSETPSDDPDGNSSESGDSESEELETLDRAEDFVETHAAGFGYHARGDQFVLEFWKPDLSFEIGEDQQVKNTNRDLVSGSRVFMTTRTALSLYKSLDSFFDDVDLSEDTGENENS